MNEDYIEYELSDGTKIFIEEMNPVYGGARAVSESTKVSKLRKAILPLSKFAAEMKDVLKENIESADKITIEFGAKLSADIGVVIAKSQVEANFKVGLTWNKSTPDPS